MRVYSFLACLVGLSLSVAQAATETVELTSRRVKVASHETILVRTPETPATVKIEFPSFRAYEACLEYGTATTYGQSESCGKETVITRNCDSDGNCSEMYTYPPASCTYSYSTCDRSETRYHAKTAVLKIKFRSPRKLRGEKEFYVLRTPVRGGDASPITLTRDGAVAPETFQADRRRKILVRGGGNGPRGFDAR